MRKLKLQVQMTVDGYIGGTNGEMDWTARDWDDELKKYVTEITAVSYTHLTLPTSDIG